MVRALARQRGDELRGGFECRPSSLNIGHGPQCRREVCAPWYLARDDITAPEHWPRSVDNETDYFRSRHTGSPQPK